MEDSRNNAKQFCLFTYAVFQKAAFLANKKITWLNTFQLIFIEILNVCSLLCFKYTNISLKSFIRRVKSGNNLLWSIYLASLTFVHTTSWGLILFPTDGFSLVCTIFDRTWSNFSSVLFCFLLRFFGGFLHILTCSNTRLLYGSKVRILR